MNIDRRLLSWALVAFAVGASWVWAAARIGGPDAARGLAITLTAATAAVAVLALLYALRAGSGPRRATVLTVGVVCLAAASGVVAAAHITGTASTSGTVTIGTNDGLLVRVQGNNDMLLTNPQVDATTANVITESGNATVSSPGSANVTFAAAADIEGTWTNGTNIDADPNEIEINPDDKAKVNVSKQITDIAFTGSMAEDDGNVDFVYTASGGAGQVEATGFAANTKVFAIDDDTTNILDDVTTDGSGTATFSSLDSGTHDVLVQASFNTGTPQLSEQAPTGGQSTPPTQLSVQVNDSAFSSGDTVDVTFTLDGNTVNTQTISSNQTVTESIPASGKTGGSHSWQVDATDSFGNTATSSHSYSVPDQLTFREEEPDHPIIKNTGPGTLECTATLFEDVQTSPDIVRRSTTDGNISLTGLPVSSQFSVSVMCPHHYNRTATLDNIFSQSNVFLIDKNETIKTNRFVVNDRTGQFSPADTELFVQAPINETKYNGSGGIKWLNGAGDDLGADEALVTDLIDEKRYRIKVQNDEGDSRILGAYTAETNGTIQLNIGNVTIAPDQQDDVAFEALWRNQTGNQPEVRFEYNDTSDNTSKLYVHIYERNNQSNELLTNTSYNGPFGTFTTTETVPKGENDTTWVVDVTAKRTGGNNINIVRPVGPGAPTLTAMPAWIVTILFVGLTWMVAGLFSQLNGHVGGLVVAGMGGMFYFIGLVPGYLGGAVVALSMLVAGVLFIRGVRGGAGV